MALGGGRFLAGIRDVTCEMKKIRKGNGWKERDGGLISRENEKWPPRLKVSASDEPTV